MISKEENDKVIKRQEANIEILDILKNWVEQNPELRFGQILACANIIKYDYSKQIVETVDPFFEESVDTLKNIKRPND